jgi:hypothetical protein
MMPQAIHRCDASGGINCQFAPVAGIIAVDGEEGPRACPGESAAVALETIGDDGERPAAEGNAWSGQKGDGKEGRGRSSFDGSREGASSGHDAAAAGHQAVASRQAGEHYEAGDIRRATVCRSTGGSCEGE